MKERQSKNCVKMDMPKKTYTLSPSSRIYLPKEIFVRTILYSERCGHNVHTDMQLKMSIWRLRQAHLRRSLSWWSSRTHLQVVFEMQKHYNDIIRASLSAAARKPDSAENRFLPCPTIPLDTDGDRKPASAHHRCSIAVQNYNLLFASSYSHLGRLQHRPISLLEARSTPKSKTPYSHQSDWSISSTGTLSGLSRNTSAIFGSEKLCSLSTGTQHLSNCFASWFIFIEYDASRYIFAYWFFSRAIMVVHARGVHCNGDIPRCIPCELDVLEEASMYCSCIATDLVAETILVSNSDLWSIAGVWQVVE